MSSSYGSRWPGAPNFTTVLMSQDVFANPGTPLTVIGGGGGGGGTPPSSAPPPVAGTVTSTQIEITFDIAGVTGTEPITWEGLYSSSPGGFLNPIFITGLGTVYTGVVNGLTSNTPYYFVSRGINTAGQTTSTEVQINTAAVTPSPNVAPSIPVASDISPSSMTVTFNTSSVVGSPTPTYLLGFGTTDPPLVIYSTISVGSEASVILSTLNANSVYYTQSIAFVDFANVSSSVTTPVSTISVSGTAPTAPTAPQPSLANNGGMISTLYFDTANQIGTPPVTYDMFWNVNGLNFLSTAVTLSTGTTIYSGVVNDLKTNNGVFQVYSRATNAVNNAFSDNTAILGSTIASPVTATPSTMNATGLFQTTIGLSTSIIVSGNPTSEIVAQFGTVSSLLSSTTGTFNLISAYPNALSSIVNLASSTTYYFNTLAYNIFGSTVNTSMVAFSTIS